MSYSLTLIRRCLFVPSLAALAALGAGCSHAPTSAEVEQTCDYPGAERMSYAWIESHLWKRAEYLQPPLFKHIAGEWIPIGRYIQKDPTTHASRVFSLNGLNMPFRSVEFAASSANNFQFQATFRVDSSQGGNPTLGPYALNEIEGRMDSINSDHYGFVQGEGANYLSDYDMRIARNRNFLFLNDGHEFLLLRKRDCVADAPRSGSARESEPSAPALDNGNGGTENKNDYQNNDPPTVPPGAPDHSDEATI